MAEFYSQCLGFFSFRLWEKHEFPPQIEVFPCLAVVCDIMLKGGRGIDNGLIRVRYLCRLT
jgi:hypothetical protein